MVHNMHVYIPSTDSQLTLTQNGTLSTCINGMTKYQLGHHKLTAALNFTAIVLMVTGRRTLHNRNCLQLQRALHITSI